jgi:hypothetical protein
MSRSYCHTPMIIQGGGIPEIKRAAAKAVRRLPLEEVSNGRFYRRAFPQWDLKESRYTYSGKARLFRRAGHNAELHFEPINPRR